MEKNYRSNGMRKGQFFSRDSFDSKHDRFEYSYFDADGRNSYVGDVRVSSATSFDVGLLP